MSVWWMSGHSSTDFRSMHTLDQAFRGMVKERKINDFFLTIPFFSKGTELNGERGEIRVSTFSSFYIYIYIYIYTSKQRTKGKMRKGTVVAATRSTIVASVGWSLFCYFTSSPIKYYGKHVEGSTWKGVAGSQQKRRKKHPKKTEKRHWKRNGKLTVPGVGKGTEKGTVPAFWQRNCHLNDFLKKRNVWMPALDQACPKSGPRAKSGPAWFKIMKWIRPVAHSTEKKKRMSCFATIDIICVYNVFGRNATLFFFLFFF